MRPQKVLDKDIYKGLGKVFRSKGYEGASLKDLADATGLKKASLYHRFPNGKQEMAETVYNYLGQWVEENIFKALTDDDKTPEERLKNGLEQISTFYNGGKNSCIFRALSMETGLELFEIHVKEGMKAYLSIFEKLGLAFKLESEDARKKALQTLINIQGSLLVTRAMDDLTIFEETLINIKNNYLNT